LVSRPQRDGSLSAAGFAAEGIPGGFRWGYLLLNRANIKDLPEDRTLAHELVHEWFGNSVFISWKTGNWAEGVAIYFADHGFQEGADAGGGCR
jgi:hypothetical protein